MTSHRATILQPNTKALCVDVVGAIKVGAEIRQAWARLRHANPDLWSPYFDMRMFDMLSDLAPHAKLAVVRHSGEIVALLPFQGKAGGLARPLGAPLSDQHSLIQAKATGIEISDVLREIGMTGFVFTGLHHEVAGTLKSQESMCHVADLSGRVRQLHRLAQSKLE